ncbi:MAG: hypothetical protein DRJ35_01170 [Thermoprotei archaeon]|nr:MAG: hypothetical protein DRJ35_01170 [Thermoprotei archaeon]
MAGKAGLDVKKVTAKLRSLLKNGYVERPTKEKYVITEKGRQIISS